jgi:hypothetical protein
MKGILNAENFWNEFSIEFNKEYYKKELKNETYGEKGEWTKWMTSFLIKMGKKNSFHTDCEYWPRVDVGYFSESSDNWGKWSFEIAIEHENDPYPKWQDELCKLMVINAGLKVLISYRKEPYKELLKKLNGIKAIYKSRKYHQVNDQYLFIFGPDQSIWEDEDFLAFTFDGKEIKDITNGKATIQKK